MSAARMRVEEELRHAEDLAMVSRGDSEQLIREAVEAIAKAIARRVDRGLAALPSSAKYQRDKRRHEQQELPQSSPASRRLVG